MAQAKDGALNGTQNELTGVRVRLLVKLKEHHVRPVQWKNISQRHHEAINIKIMGHGWNGAGGKDKVFNREV
jgi:hypothetical protein